MKRLTNINQILALFIALFVVTAFSACSDVAGPGQVDNGIKSQNYDQTSDLQRYSGTTSEPSSQTTECTSEGTSTIYAGNDDIRVGNITFKVLGNGKKVQVTFNADSGWEFSELFLWAGQDLSSISEDGTKPDGNDYTVKEEFKSAVQSKTYTIDIEFDNDPSTDGIYIVAKANAKEVRGGGTETSFAGENKEGNWWRYVFIEQTNCQKAGSFRFAAG